MVGQGRRRENGEIKKEEQGLNKLKQGKKMLREKMLDTMLLAPGVLLEHLLGLHLADIQGFFLVQKACKVEEYS